MKAIISRSNTQIGKIGFIWDNSYTFDVQTFQELNWIDWAGAMDEKIPVIVLSNPFTLKYFWSATGKYYKNKFIVILSLKDNKPYIVLNCFEPF